MDVAHVGPSDSYESRGCEVMAAKSPLFRLADSASFVVAYSLQNAAKISVGIGLLPTIRLPIRD